MRISEIDTLFAYNWWATERVLSAASGITREQFTRAGLVPVPYGSLRETLVHIVDLERSTRLRLSRNARSESVEPTRFDSIDELSAYWRAESAAMNDYLSGLLDDDLDREFAFNETERYPYWQLLLHVVNHSTQHRSEAAILLTELDRSPGDLDFQTFLREGR